MLPEGNSETDQAFHPLDLSMTVPQDPSKENDYAEVSFE